MHICLDAFFAPACYNNYFALCSGIVSENRQKLQDWSECGAGAGSSVGGWRAHQALHYHEGSHHTLALMARLMHCGMGVQSGKMGKL